MAERGFTVDQSTISRSRPAVCAGTGKTLPTASESLQ
jgi:hypothetical protein